MTEFNSGYMERFFSMPAPKEESDTGMREIELENLLAFHTGDGHPFEVEMDQDMQELMEDVRETGFWSRLLSEGTAHSQGDTR